MRTPLSDLLGLGLRRSLEKAPEALTPQAASERSRRAWETRHEHGERAREEAPAAREEARGEVFAAALRGFHGDIAATRGEHERNARLRDLGRDLGEAGGDFATGAAEGMVGEAKLDERNRAVGAWYETDVEGKRMPVSEPSFHAIVRGDEHEILRRAAALGRKYGQQAVAVAVHDPSGEGRVFAVDLREGADDRAVETMIAHFLEAGLGGATGLLDRPSLRLLATGPEDVAVIERVLAGLPKEYGALARATPARVRFVGESEYETLIAAKAAAADGEVVAEVLVGGVRAASRPGGPAEGA